MFKYLVVIALLIGGAQKNVPLNGKQQQDQSQAHPADTHPSAQPSAASEVAQENAANAERYAYYKAHPKEYLKAAIAPTNASNWVLAGLGCIGGFLAYLTLLSIKRQADLMKEQSDTARQKERPKLRIKLGQVNLNLADSPDMVVIECEIQNHGGSVAFISGDGYKCWIGTPSESEGAKNDRIPINLPEVLKPGDKPYDPAMFLPDEGKIVDWTLWNNSDPRIESVRKGDRFIYLTGHVMYTNVFNETWMLKFRRKYTVFHYGVIFQTAYGADTAQK